jgi:hypothetical protein
MALQVLRAYKETLGRKELRGRMDKLDIQVNKVYKELKVLQEMRAPSDLKA